MKINPPTINNNDMLRNQHIINDLMFLVFSGNISPQNQNTTK